MNLTNDIVAFAETHQTPFLLCDLDIIRDNYRRIVNSIPGVELFYAVKANNADEVLRALIDEGSSFDIASNGELQQLKDLSVPPEKIICFNPIKNATFLKDMKEYGVELLAYDSHLEVDKIAEHAPGSKLLLRLQVENEGSEWPLTKKFGVQMTEAMDLLKYAQSKNVDVIGLTFHVGSQCLNKDNWVSALYVCEEVWKEALAMGMPFSLLSLGGGMPVKHLKDIPSIEEIGALIAPVIEERFKKLTPNMRVTIEPGRGLVGDSAVMVTSVVGVAKRGIEKWVYLDAGVFNGLMETIEEFKYDLQVPGSGEEREIVTIAGPSCDSVDVTFKNYSLPPVKLDDKIFILNTGAYTLAYGSKFNGFDVPKLYFVHNN